MSARKAINEHLFYAFGYDLRQDPSDIAEAWPFKLQLAGTVQSGEDEIEIFQFAASRKVYFVSSGRTLAYFPAAGMTVDDIRSQYEGAAWIAHHDPVDLATSRLGDPLVPSVTERQGAIERLATSACASHRILEGLFLKRLETYLALIEETHTGVGTIVGTSIEPRCVSFPEASAWRRLAVGVGEMVKEGFLK